MKPTSISARTANMLRCHRFSCVPPSLMVAVSVMEMVTPSTVPTKAEPFQSPAMPVSSARVVEDFSGVFVLMTFAPRMDDARTPLGCCCR